MSRILRPAVVVTIAVSAFLAPASVAVVLHSA